MSQFPESRFSGTQRPELTKGAIALIVLLGIAWVTRVAVAPVGAFVEANLWVRPDTLPTLKLWAPLTYALIPQDFLGYVLNAMMLYFFAGTVEERLGPERTYWMYVLSAVLGGLTAALLMWPMAGTEFGAGLRAISGFSAPVAALVAAYCYPYWNQTLLLFGLEIKGKVLLSGFVALGALLALLALHPGLFATHLAGVGVGLGIVSGSFVPKDLFKRIQYWRIKRRLKVIARTPESDKNDDRKRSDGTWIN